MAGKSDDFNFRGNTIMALKKPTPAAETNFEDGAEGENVEQTQTETQTPAQRLAAAAAEREAAKPKEAASTNTAVAAAKSTAVGAARSLVDPLKGLENAFRVEYDTLRNLVITNGNVMDKDTNKALGDVIGMELLSFQSQWVVSPGVDGEEAKEHVRYSDDGKTTSKGEDCNEYLADLKAAGYPDAKISERTVICGSIFEPGKMKDMKDSLVQINLPPTSKAAFQRYRMDQAFKIGKDLIDGAGAERIKLECTLTTRGTNTWTVADFSRWPD